MALRRIQKVFRAHVLVAVENHIMRVIESLPFPRQFILEHKTKLALRWDESMLGQIQCLLGERPCRRCDGI